MPVSEFLKHKGNRSLEEMSYRVAIANDLKITLADLAELPATELDDWFLLYDVEREAQAIEVVNAERRKG